MSTILSFPPNSFLNPQTDGACMDNVQECLPVYSPADIDFNLLAYVEGTGAPDTTEISVNLPGGSTALGTVSSWYIVPGLTTYIQLPCYLTVVSFTPTMAYYVWLFQNEYGSAYGAWSVDTHTNSITATGLSSFTGTGFGDVSFVKHSVLNCYLTLSGGADLATAVAWLNNPANGYTGYGEWSINSSGQIVCSPDDISGIASPIVCAGTTTTVCYLTAGTGIDYTAAIAWLNANFGSYGIWSLDPYNSSHIICTPDDISGMPSSIAYPGITSTTCYLVLSGSTDYTGALAWLNANYSAYGPWTEDLSNPANFYNGTGSIAGLSSPIVVPPSSITTCYISLSDPSALAGALAWLNNPINGYSPAFGVFSANMAIPNTIISTMGDLSGMPPTIVIPGEGDVVLTINCTTITNPGYTFTLDCTTTTTGALTLNLVCNTVTTGAFTLTLTCNTSYYVTITGYTYNINDVVNWLNYTESSYGTWSETGGEIFVGGLTSGFDITIDGLTYTVTCPEEVSAQTWASMVSLSSLWTTGSFNSQVNVGGCFTLNVGSLVTGCFTRIPDKCFTSLIRYRNNENAFGFIYFIDNGSGGNLLAGQYNQFRLPFFLDKPQTKTTRQVYRKSDGNYVKLSAIMEKEYEAEVSWMTDDWHTGLAIALEHDDFEIYDDANAVWDNYILSDGDYSVDWKNEPGINLNVAPAKFKLKSMPFDNMNSNC